MPTASLIVNRYFNQQINLSGLNRVRASYSSFLWCTSSSHGGSICCDSNTAYIGLTQNRFSNNTLIGTKLLGGSTYILANQINYSRNCCQYSTTEYAGQSYYNEGTDYGEEIEDSTSFSSYDKKGHAHSTYFSDFISVLINLCNISWNSLYSYNSLCFDSTGHIDVSFSTFSHNTNTGLFESISAVFECKNDNFVSNAEINQDRGMFYTYKNGKMTVESSILMGNNYTHLTRQAPSTQYITVLFGNTLYSNSFECPANNTLAEKEPKTLEIAHYVKKDCLKITRIFSSKKGSMLIQILDVLLMFVE